MLAVTVHCLASASPTPSPVHGDPLLAPPSAATIVTCAIETEPIATREDAIDDPSFWPNSSDPLASLIIGTDKKFGLRVYDLSGRQVQELPDGRMNNVDIALNVRAPQGTLDLALATNRTDNTVVAYAITGTPTPLSRVEELTIAPDIGEVYGICVYTHADGACRVFVGSKSGTVKEFSLSARGGSWSAREVRRFEVGAQVEGMVADAAHDRLYIGEEALGVWVYPLAVPQDPEAEVAPRYLLDTVRTGDSLVSGNLAPDVEGIALYEEAGGRGILLVSCQGENRYAAYDRVSMRYLGSISLAFGAADPVTHTDGIAASSAVIADIFPRGILIAQDDNDGEPQNFKIADWRLIEAALSGK
jgi:3-phytase